MSHTIHTPSVHSFGKVFADAEPAPSAPLKDTAAALHHPDAPIAHHSPRATEPQTVTAEDIAHAAMQPAHAQLAAVVALLDRDPRQLTAIVKSFGGHLERAVASSPLTAYAARGKLLEHIIDSRARLELLQPIVHAVAERAGRSLEAEVGDRISLFALLATLPSEPARFAAVAAVITAHLPIEEVRDYYRAIADEQGGSLAVLAALEQLV